MDAHRFDALARVLATPGSRRRALRALIGGALAVTALGRRPLGAKAVQCGNDPGLGCGEGFTCCVWPGNVFAGCCNNGGCCGAGVDMTCCPSGTSCNDATGKCVAPPPACAEGTTRCGDVCCGEHGCSSSGTSCALPPPPPPPPCGIGEVRCSDVCVNKQTDAANCGACDRTCPSGRHCSGGKCCPTGTTNCGGTCVNLRTNAANCGACGRACLNGKHCSKGKCCTPGTTNCGGACVNLLTNVANCGRCGKSCTGGKVCKQGTCV